MGRCPMSGKTGKNIDPLFELFEHYLLTKSYSDSAKFTKEVAGLYLAYIDSTPAHVPFHSRSHVLEDLEAETHELLVKKMYGCVRVTDYENCGRVMQIDNGEELKPFEFNREKVRPPAETVSKK
jgi:hypothetical protein